MRTHRDFPYRGCTPHIHNHKLQWDHMCLIWVKPIAFVYVLQSFGKSNTKIFLHKEMDQLMSLLLWPRFTQLLNPTLPNLPYSILPSFRSSYMLWCTNLKCSSPLSFIHHPIMPLKVCKPSSLSFLQETTCPLEASHPIPNKPSIFLFNTRRLLKFPFMPI